MNNNDDIDDANPYWLENNTDETPPTDNDNPEVFKNTSDNPYTVNYTFIPKKEQE